MSTQMLVVWSEMPPDEAGHLINQASLCFSLWLGQVCLLHIYFIICNTLNQCPIFSTGPWSEPQVGEHYIYFFPPVSLVSAALKYGRYPRNIVDRLNKLTSSYWLVTPTQSNHFLASVCDHREQVILITVLDYFDSLLIGPTPNVKCSKETEEEKT